MSYIAGYDLRPLLVLRECRVCNGTDDALLKGGIDNERTFLLSAWFHCVKLPLDVVDKDHPFHALFREGNAEHLFFSSPDGLHHKALESQTSRAQLWKAMHAVLRAEYRKAPKSSLIKITNLLSKLDEQDVRLDLLLSRQDQILDKSGPGSSKLPKLAAKIAKEEAVLSKLNGKIAEAYRVQLRGQKNAREAKSAKGAEAAKAR